MAVSFKLIIEGNTNTLDNAQKAVDAVKDKLSGKSWVSSIHTNYSE